ncbi:MAG: HEAT repeat domain-containing protein [Fimbriimonadaceae bacterium]
MRAILVVGLGAAAALSCAQTKLPEGYVDKLIADLAKDIPNMELGWPYHFPNNSVPSAVESFAWFGEAAISHMIPLLDSDEYWQVVIGALTLAKLGDRSQIHKMTLMAQDHDKPGVRQIVIRALGELKAKEAVEAIIEVLRRGDESHVMSTAVEALGEIGDPRAIPVLVENLGRQVPSQIGSPSTSWAEIFALGKFGEQAIPALEPLVRSDDKTKAGAALRALAEIKSERTKQIVVSALDDPEAFDTAANIFMTTEQQYDGDVLVRLFDRFPVQDQAWLVEILHKHGDKRAPEKARGVWATIYAQLVAGEARGYDLLRVLERIRRVGIRPPAIELLDAVGRSDDARVVKYAFDLLTSDEINTGAEVIVAKLADWYPENHDGDELDGLAETLAKAGPNGGSAAIALVTEGKGTDEFRRVALAKMMRPEHADGLRQLVQGKDEKLALYAAIGLVNLGKRDSAVALRRFATSSDEMTAALALSTLMKLGDPWGRSEYIDRFSRYYFGYSARKGSPNSQFLVVHEYEVGLRYLSESGRELLASEVKRLYGANKEGFHEAIFWLLGAKGSWAKEMLDEGSAEVKSLVLSSAGEQELVTRYRALLFDKDPGLRYQAYRYLKGEGEFDPPPKRRPGFCQAAW